MSHLKHPVDRSQVQPSPGSPRGEKNANPRGKRRKGPAAKGVFTGTHDARGIVILTVHQTPVQHVNVISLVCSVLRNSHLTGDSVTRWGLAEQQQRSLRCCFCLEGAPLMPPQLLA